MTAGMEMHRPTRMVRPRSASKVPAMAMGPGVGGTRQWVAYRPPDRAVPITAKEMLDCWARARLMGERTTKPESQNTGMPVT